MDPLSITASVIAVITLTATVIKSLNDFKDVSENRTYCALEASNLLCLLIQLRQRLEEGGENEPWHSAVKALGVENGPLDQFKRALETIQTKMTAGSRLKNLTWTIKKMKSMVSFVA